MHPNPPAPMPWEEYERRLVNEWQALLNSAEGCNERIIHDFLIQHPCMIPGAYSMTGSSGHGPFPMAVLSESPLSGVGMKIPDFIWLAKDSATFTPVFIELESPCKRWFTEKGVPTHDLTQAMNQLAEWRGWLNRPENVTVFYETYEIPDYLRRHRTFRPEFVLIYGRRKEFEERPELNRLRDQYERHGQVVMTFDRLRPSRNSSIYMCATKRSGHDTYGNTLLGRAERSTGRHTEHILQRQLVIEPRPSLPNRPGDCRMQTFSSAKVLCKAWPNGEIRSDYCG